MSYSHYKKVIFGGALTTEKFAGAKIAARLGNNNILYYNWILIRLFTQI